MIGRRLALTALTLVASGILLGASPQPEDPIPSGATLDGVAITVGEAARLSCHDLERTIVRCFATDKEMRASAERTIGASRSNAVEAAAVGYVIVYEHSGYDGASRLLSVDYSYLGTIGWNDRITSFKSFGATGSFREHAPPGGFLYGFSSSTMVINVGSTYNDRFSAFLIN